jgi:aspartate/methionine/tyrosine aminotransferase
VCGKKQHQHTNQPIKIHNTNNKHKHTNKKKNKNSPNTVGQVAVSCMVNPPRPGDPSYDLYARECADELASLKRRAKVVSAAFASLPGMSCQPTEGGMYSFPKLLLPDAALEAARAAGKAPDAFYCLRLLEEAGISTVPGSGFGQAVGTAHFRTTILPREDVVAEFVDKVGS